MTSNSQGVPTPASAQAMAGKPATSLARKAYGYLLVGGLAAIVDIGLFHLLTHYAFSPLNPTLGGNILLAAALSFGLAALVNYGLSSFWVYRRNWQSARRAALFLSFALVGLSINSGATWWLAHNLPIMPTLAKIGGVAVAFVVNFLMNTFIVFKAEDR